MKHVAAIAVLSLLALPAWAQDNPQVNAPAKEMPPLPIAAMEKAATAAPFPALPPSDPCESADVMGLWRLAQVYEAPEGAEKAAFITSPVQYLLFNSNTTFGRYNAGATELSAADAMSQIDEYSGPLLQFVVQNGMMFFYQEQKASDTQACFIVREPRDAFVAGQMLLMPPKGQIQGRLVKAYRRADDGAARAYPSAQPPSGSPPESLERAQEMRRQYLEQQQKQR